VDGSGAPARRAEILIAEEKIAGLLPASVASSSSFQVDQVIEAAGRVVAPGFIDIHSHGDLVLARPPEEQLGLMAGRLAQGITTEIVGNCGLGVFPWSHPTLPVLRAVVAWMTPSGVDPEDAAPEWPWTDLLSYLSHLESNGVCVNAGALQPHGPLRIEQSGLDRSVSEGGGAGGLDRMSRRLEEALDAGAFGLSTGLIYPPGIYATPEEIARLARVVARRCGEMAFVASHIRGSSETLLPAVGELIDLARDAGVRVQHSHNEAVGRGHWRKIDQVLEKEENARQSGLGVAYDMFPYTAAATTMLAIYPPWSLEGGVEMLLRRLADPGQRRAIGEAIEEITPSWPPWTEKGWPHNLVKAVGWERITIGSVASPGNRPLEGMSLAELGRVKGLNPFDAISGLMVEEQGRVSQIIHEVSGEPGDETGIESLLRHPMGAVCTDANEFGMGKPHPAAYGTFPRVLGEYVRRRGLLSLETAIHKMTGYPASLLGLNDRGVIRPGAWADLVVFDLEAIDSEASFEEPRAMPRGVDCVFVNGQVVVRNGVIQNLPGKPAGKVLRRPA